MESTASYCELIGSSKPELRDRSSSSPLPSCGLMAIRHSENREKFLDIFLLLRKMWGLFCCSIFQTQVQPQPKLKTKMKCHSRLSQPNSISSYARTTGAAALPILGAAMFSIAASAAG